MRMMLTQSLSNEHMHVQTRSCPHTPNVSAHTLCEGGATYSYRGSGKYVNVVPESITIGCDVKVSVGTLSKRPCRDIATTST